MPSSGAVVEVAQRKNEYLLEVNGAAFLLALRCRTHVTSTHRDPLAGAWRFLEENGETGEGRALRKVIRMLATTDGEFSESEVWLFSAETLPLVAALVEAWERGL